MNPSAEPAQLPAHVVALVPADRIEDGEIILLAVKPSLWFVVLTSWPVLVMAGVVAGATCVAQRAFDARVNTDVTALICAAVACTRLTLACFQWQGRLYVLTDRRVMRLRGMFHVDCYQCPLKSIAGIRLASSAPERAAGVANLLFDRDDGKDIPDGHWTVLAEPKQVFQTVSEAWRRTR